MPDPAEKDAFFDDVARSQGGFVITPEQAPKLERLRQRLGDLEGRTVIEPGCGSGSLTVHLAAWVGATGRVRAFDPSKGMVALARQAATALPQVRLSRDRVEMVDIPPGEADCVVCFRALPHFDDPELAIDRFASWLRPGGVLHIAHWNGRDKLAAMHAASEPVTRDVFPPGPALSDWLQTAGFRPLVWIDDSREIYIAAERF